MDFPSVSMVENPTANAGDVGLIPGSERSPGGRNGNTVQYSYLENPMDRGAWWATVHSVTKSWTRLKWLSMQSSVPGSIYSHFLKAISQTCGSLCYEPMEEGVANHFSILAWRIPWTEEPGGLQSIVSQKVGHDWNYLAHNLQFQGWFVPISLRPFLRPVAACYEPMEEGVANHFSILAWRIPWTEEPGGIQSIVSQRVGHGWRDFARTCYGYSMVIM